MSEEQAIARYEGYLRQDPDNTSLLIAVGDLYHRSGRQDEPLACYERSLADDAQHALAQGRIASVMLSRHRFAEAEQALRGLLDQGEPDAVPLHNP